MKGTPKVSVVAPGDLKTATGFLSFDLLFSFGDQSMWCVVLPGKGHASKCSPQGVARGTRAVRQNVRPLTGVSIQRAKQATQSKA